MPPTPNDPNDAGRAAAADAMLLDTAPLANPFVGLRPFESAEALLFFGRDEQTTELMQQLHLTRFLAVVGSSGCGKSSLIRAGLIPKLKAGFLLADRGDWRVAAMKPGKAPLQNLAAALLAAFDEDPAGDGLRPLVEEIEAAGAEAVVEYLSRRPEGKAANFLLLVDQFEEIFRFGAFTDEGPDEGPDEDPDERERRRAEAADFVSIMLGLTRGDAVPVYVVMTMRSDFLGDCDAFHGLPQAMNRSQYLVPRLTRQQRLEAIQCPARLCRKTISPGLVVRVLDDMGEDSDQLPVMQHALMRTFDKSLEEEKINPRREKGPGDYDIRLEHYEAVGTLKSALSKDADEALAGMGKEELIVTERMFQALVETDAKERRVRRPVHLSEVEAITGADRGQIERIIARFRDNNRSFLTLSEDRLHGDALIDISHESLIRQWETLKGWAKDEVESKDLYLRLAGDAVRYCHRQAPLWIDPALQLALDWWEKRQPNRAWANRYHARFALAQGFLRRSRLKREADLAEAERRRDEQLTAEREQREKAELYASQQEIAARRLRRLTGALAALALLMLIAAGYALTSRRTAKNALGLADKRLDAGRLYREAAKAANALKVDEARDLYGRAAYAYSELKEFDAVAHTYSELGQMMLSQETDEQDVDTEEWSSEEAPQNLFDFQKLDRAKTQDWILGYEPAPEGFFKALYITPEQQQGISYYGQAVRMSRQHQDAAGSAAALDKVGEFLTTGSDAWSVTTGDSVSRSWRNRYAIDLFCDALNDYSGVFNLEGQISLLIKIGATQPLRVPGGEAAGAAAGSNADQFGGEVARRKANLTGCDGKESSAVAYYERTLPLYEELLRRSPDQKQVERNREEWAETLTKIGETYNEAAMTSEAVKWLDQAASLYRDEGKGYKPSPKHRVRASAILTNAGRLLSKAEMTAEAARRFEQAVNVHRDAGDLKQAVATLIEIAGKLPEGAVKDEYYRRALQTYRDAGDPEQEIKTLFQIANAQYRAGDLADGSKASSSFKTALKYVQQAESASASMKNNRLQAEALLHSAEISLRLVDQEAALTKLKQALELAQKENALDLQARAYYGFGVIHENNKQTRQAVDAYTRAVELFGKAGDLQMGEYISSRISALEKPPAG